MTAWEDAFRQEWQKQSAALEERYLKAVLDTEAVIRNHTGQKSALGQTIYRADTIGDSK